MASKSRGKRGSFRTLMLEAQRKQSGEGNKKLSRKEKKDLKKANNTNQNNEEK